MKKNLVISICIALILWFGCISGVGLADSSITIIKLPEKDIPQFVPSKKNEADTIAQEPEYEVMKPTVSLANQIHGYNAETGTYQYLYLGKYEQTRGGQPILWRVLIVEGNDALLLSERILTAMSFGRSNQWEQSQIKKWLNSAFMMEAFSSKERKAIYDSESLGQVFILSKAELRNSDYGFSTKEDRKDKQRCAKGTTFAVDEGLYVNDDNQCSTYYTRTAPNNKNVTSITSEGGFGLVKTNRDDVGVRPAMWVNLKELSFSEGDGTIQYPYQ